MILARAPLRISFAGGGSDLRAFSAREPGAVVSVTIDKHVRCSVAPSDGGWVYEEDGRRRVSPESDGIEHDLVREALLQRGVRQPLEITTRADLPFGSGLGSSGALTVALLHALHALEGSSPPPGRLAEEAVRVEWDAGTTLGRQDQYAASFGGLNHIRFHGAGATVERVRCPPGTLDELHERLLLVRLGGTRSASTILRRQASRIEAGPARPLVRRLARLADVLREELEAGRVEACGEILREGWELKRASAPDISTPLVDEACATALRAGASGAKLLGAGAAGYLLVYCDPRVRPAVRQALDRFQELPFSFSFTGSTVGWARQTTGGP